MATTHFPFGVTNVPQASATGTLLFPDPSRCHTFYDDFDKFFVGAPGADPAVLGDWLITGSTPGTTLITDADGGVVAITNDSTNAHSTYAQWAGNSGSGAETFTWDSSLPLWFKARFKLSNVTDSAMVMGLQITDASPLDASDGLFFTKADTSTSLVFKAVKTGAGTTSTTIGTLANDTYVEVVFAYLPYGDDLGSPMPACLVYLNGNRVAALTDFTNFPTTELTVSFGAANGAAGTSIVMSADYILASKARAQTSLTS